MLISDKDKEIKFSVDFKTIYRSLAKPWLCKNHGPVTIG